jgi:glycerol kinase
MCLEFQSVCSSLTHYVNCHAARVPDPETTSKGAAIMAGLAVGLFSVDEIRGVEKRQNQFFHPKILPERRTEMLRGWKRAFASLDDGEEKQ